MKVLRDLCLFVAIVAPATACGIRTPLEGAFAPDAPDVKRQPDLALPGDGHGSQGGGNGGSPDTAPSDHTEEGGWPPELLDGAMPRDVKPPDVATAPPADVQIPVRYPLAQPGHGLTDILPTIAESDDCLRCVTYLCPAAIICANEALCADQVSCLVAICSTSSALLPPPPMSVPNPAARCAHFPAPTDCLTSGCSLPSQSAALSGLRAAACVYELCYPPRGAPGYVPD